MSSAIENPGYYAVIPASVRYDHSLTPNAKLLYGEITALCRREGYCFATNAYFAQIYEVNERKIQDWLSRLKRGKYITVEVIDGNTRKIHLATPKTAPRGADNGMAEGSPSPSTPTPTPGSNNTREGRFVPPTLEECFTYCRDLKMPVGEAEDFHDYYNSVGWKVGRKSMKDWKAAMRRWARKYHEQHPYDPNDPPSYEPRRNTE